jgi:hypothetical protein
LIVEVAVESRLVKAVRQAAEKAEKNQNDPSDQQYDSRGRVAAIRRSPGCHSSRMVTIGASTNRPELTAARRRATTPPLVCAPRVGGGLQADARLDVLYWLSPFDCDGNQIENDQTRVPNAQHRLRSTTAFGRSP